MVMTGRPQRRSGRAAPAHEAAAAWVLRQEENPLSESEESAFAEWLNHDTRHVAAYQDALWALDATARHAGEPELLALRGAALAAVGSRKLYWSWAAGLAAAAALIAAVSLWLTTPAAGPLIGKASRVAERTFNPNRSVYRTGIGERSAIALPDGSVATLDTDSQIRVAYGPTERGVYLLRGQALFEVAHGKPAPFQVYAGSQRITAVGTKFNVRLEGAEVRVAMVEGAVRVRAIPQQPSDATLPVGEMILSAGEGLVAQPDKPSVVSNVDATQVVSWKGGVLTFNDTRLSDAVAEMNRYTTRSIAIADGAVGNYRISGVFKSNDPEHFSQAVAEVLPVDVTHAPGGPPTLRTRVQ
jgi:transmembrane sensor